MAQVTISEKEDVMFFLTGFCIANDKGNAYASIEQNTNYSEEVDIKSCFIVNDSETESVYVAVTDINNDVLKFRIAASESFEEVFYKTKKIEIVSNNTYYRAILRK